MLHDESKTVLCLSEKDVDGLLSKTVNDVVSLNIQGVIKGVSEASDMRGEKYLSYSIEVTKASPRTKKLSWD